MTRAELEHAIRAACDVAGDSELWVFGSQAILGEHPEAPATLRQSMELDVAPRNQIGHVDRIDGALGELSPFHETYGFYVHGVSIDVATLSDGWKDRTVAVSGRGLEASTGWCLESHDLAAAKLAAFREKDRDFVRTLITEGLVKADTLLDRIGQLPIDDTTRARLLQWVSITAGL